MKKSIKLGAFISAILAMSSAPVFAGPAPLLNQGFEMGLSGWETFGDVKAVSATSVSNERYEYHITPYENQMAQLDSGAIYGPDADIFFGTRSGELESWGVTTVAGIKQTFRLLPNGDNKSIILYWNYVGRDYAPVDDLAFFTVNGGFDVHTLQPLASIAGPGIKVGDFGNSGWHWIEYTPIYAGTYTIAFGVADTYDTELNGTLFLDTPQRFQYSPIPEVPEPATYAMFIAGLGMVGFISRRRKIS